jgi:uncharacterized membrane protein
LDCRAIKESEEARKRFSKAKNRNEGTMSSEGMGYLYQKSSGHVAAVRWLSLTGNH